MIMTGVQSLQQALTMTRVEPMSDQQTQQMPQRTPELIAQMQYQNNCRQDQAQYIQ